MTPVKTASETELSEGAITTKQTKRTELKWIIVGVIDAPITSLECAVQDKRQDRERNRRAQRK